MNIYVDAWLFGVNPHQSSDLMVLTRKGKPISRELSGDPVEMLMQHFRRLMGKKDVFFSVAVNLFDADGLHLCYWGVEPIQEIPDHEWVPEDSLQLKGMSEHHLSIARGELRYSFMDMQEYRTLLPSPFTIPQWRRVVEQITGTPQDRRNFQRSASRYVEEVDRGLYRFKGGDANG